MVGFLLIEFANLTVRLDDFSFAILAALFIDSVDGVSSLPLEASDGGRFNMLSAMLSVMLELCIGVCTGIGRSIDNLEPIGKGIGTFSDSFNGLTG